MDLRALQALLAVVDHGGFTAAARATHTVQSNVSTHVARLERELDAILIDRATGLPTQEGAAVVRRVRRVQNELAALEADVSSLRGTPRGIVRVGVIGTTARWLIPLLVDRLERQTPEIELIVADGSTESISHRVGRGDLDIGVVGLPVDEPDLTITSLFCEDHIVIAPNHHPLAKNSSPVSIEVLAEHKLLLPATGTPLRIDVDRQFAAAGFEPRTRLEVDGIRLLASLAFQGYGAAIVPATAAPGWLGGEWGRVSVEGLGQREVGLATRQRALPSVATNATIESIRAIVRSEASTVPGLRCRSGEKHHARQG